MKSANLPLIFVLMTVMIDAMGIGLIIPVMPALLQDVGMADLTAAAKWAGPLLSAYALMQFIFSPVLGALSDRIGRRPVILGALVIMSLDYLLMAVAGSIWLILIARMIGGISAANQAVASAYVADISKPEEKAARFGLIGAAFGMGFVIGPFIGGELAEFGTRAPFYAAAILAGLNALLGFFVLSETVTDKNRRAFEWKRANPFGAMLQVGRIPGAAVLLGIFLLYQMAFAVYPAIWSFWGQAQFGWSEQTIGRSLGVFGISLALVQGLLIKRFIALLGERGTLIYGIFFNISVFVFFGLIQNGTIAFLALPITALGAVVVPAITALLSKATPDNAQGELQGVMASISALTFVFSPTIMTEVFARVSPGAPFLLSALYLAGCAAIFFMATQRQRT